MHFYWFGSQLLLRVRIEKVLDKVMRDTYFLLAYQEETHFNRSSVYIVDLERKNSFDVLMEVRNKDSTSPIICISSRKNKMSVLGLGITNFFWIDKESDFEQHLEKCLLSILCEEKEESLVFYGENLKVVIPYREVVSFRKNQNMFYLQGYSNIYYSCYFSFKEDMRYNLDVKNQSFSFYSMRNFTFFCGMKEQNYSISLKEKIVRLYLNGVSVKEIRSLYGVSVSTIYNWVRKYEIKKELEKRETLLKKYLEIEKIVNR